jgi:hypothetical protein
LFSPAPAPYRFTMRLERSAERFPDVLFAARGL